MKNKNTAITFVGTLVLVMLLGAGCERPMVKNDIPLETTVNGDNMTVMMQDGVMVSEGENGKMVKMDRNMVLKDGTQVMMNGEVMKKDGTKTMMKEGEGMMMDGSMTAPHAMNAQNNAVAKGSGAMNNLGVVVLGIYEDYTPEKLVLAENKKVILFFKANWCPTCQGADKNILSSKIPSDIAILKVDYDTSFELKKKYGVTVQHTFVQVDKNGNMIKKWIGGETILDIENKLK